MNQTDKLQEQVRALESRAAYAEDRYGALLEKYVAVKRMYENTIVQKEGMQLYDEINRLNERVKHLEDVIIKGVWPK